MNIVVAKRAIIFSLILGAIIGLLSLFPNVIGFGILALFCLSAFIVILYMKRDDKYLGFIDIQQGAILGGLIGFFATVGFFVSFSPMVCVLRLISKNYYSYGIPYMVKDGLWLLIIIVFMTGLFFALTNSAVGMGMAWIYDKIEKKPEEAQNPVDIEIND